MDSVLDPSLFSPLLSDVGSSQSHCWGSVCRAALGARSSIDDGNRSEKPGNIRSFEQSALDSCTWHSACLRTDYRVTLITQITAIKERKWEALYRTSRTWASHVRLLLRGKAIQGYIKRRLPSKHRERVLFQPPVSKIPLLNAVNSSGDHIARTGLEICEGFRQDSEVILALEKLPHSKRLLWLRLCSFPKRCQR